MKKAWKNHIAPDPEPTELVSFSWSFKPCEDSSDPSDNGRKRECDPPVLAPCGEPSQIEWSQIAQIVLEKENPDNKLVLVICQVICEVSPEKVRTGDVSKWPRRSKHHQGMSQFLSFEVFTFELVLCILYVLN